jgi:hypothetical protein
VRVCQREPLSYSQYRVTAPFFCRDTFRRSFDLAKRVRLTPSSEIFRSH